jgi:D-alanyl-D-alanine carboxypeptidase (penicillin-binding protein 5/6)
MSEMRHPTGWSRLRSRRGTLVGIASCLVALATPAAVSASADPTGAVPGSPFDGVVGGTRLGISGRPVVPAGAVPPRGVDALAWLVADVGSGEVLGGYNSHAGLPPASTIKLLTALVVLPEIDADATYTATDADITVDGSRVGLVPGQRYTRATLAHGLLLASGNDAANALAQLAGGDARAIALMAEKARQLGAFDTTVRTTHGLDEPGQRTSVYDLALIGRAALGNKEIAALARTQIYDFPGLNGTTFQIQNHNRMLSSYPGAIGLKNGFTTLSGHTLVAAAERRGVRLVAVVLGAKTRPEPPASALLDWGFALPASAEPVGRLVTPAEVAAAIHEQDRRTTSAQSVVEQNPQSAVQESIERVVSAPIWPWLATVAGVLLVSAGFAFAAIRAGRNPPSVTLGRRTGRGRTTTAAATPGRRRARRG